MAASPASFHPSKARDQHGGAQLRQSVELAHAAKPTTDPVRVAPARRSICGRPARLRMTSARAPARTGTLSTMSASRGVELPDAPAAGDPGRRRRDGHHAAGRRPRPWTTSRGSRAATRSSTSPGPTWSAASTTPTSRPVPTASRPTRSARTSPTSPSTTSPTGSASWPRPAPGWPARPPTATRPPDRPRFVLGSVGPGHQAAHPRATRRTRRCATPTRSSVAGLLDGGVDAVHGRDLPGPAAGQGGGHRRPAGDDRGRPATVPLICQVTVETTGTMLLGSRDRRGADRAGAARHRPDRAELRHRPGRDERAPALPVPARAGSRCR